jgi:hypothetical protein
MNQSARQHFNKNARQLLKFTKVGFDEGIEWAKAKIEERTPVDKGDLQNNWAVRSLSRDISIIFNDMHYAHKIEYGLYPPNSTSGKTINGYSTQAQFGILRHHRDDYRNIVAKHVKKMLQGF